MFDELNQRIIQAKKELQERERILDLLDGLDRQLAQKFQKLAHLGATIRRNSGHTSPLRRVRQEIEFLQQQMLELEEALIPLADSDETYQELRHHEAQLFEKLDPTQILKLMETSKMLATNQTTIVELEEAIRWGRKAQTELAILIQLVTSPADWGALPRTTYSEERNPLARATAIFYLVQEALDRFQRELTDVNQPFTTPPTLATEAATDSDTWPAAQLIQLIISPAPTTDPSSDTPTGPENSWIRHLEHIQARLQSKIQFLQTIRNEYFSSAQALKEERRQLIKKLWQG